MTKNELKEKIKVIVKNSFTKKEEGKPAPEVKPYFAIIARFPQIDKVLTDLMTKDYYLFIDEIDWVAPNPTTLRIRLGNGEYYYLSDIGRSWIAQVEGKKYYLLNLNEKQYAAEAISRVLRYGESKATQAAKSAAAEEAEAGGETAAPEEIGEIPPAPPEGI